MDVKLVVTIIVPESTSVEPIKKKRAQATKGYARAPALILEMDKAFSNRAASALRKAQKRKLSKIVAPETPAA